MATTRKTTQSRTPAKRSTAKKSTARKSAAKKSAAAPRSEPQPRPEPAEQAEPKPRSLRTVAISAAHELSELIGQSPEGIVAVEKRDEGWLVQVQVVESRRIPATTDILAVYEVEVADDGSVTGYRRADRYVRGRIQE
ncbi:gas vesicle protein [Kribbella sp. NPDC003505]|uniref:gas vesicle protein GvpO n=1 Tax=Kribbella sp. NPDC003505 TaxID=3154448 RepID=UPI0033B1C335